MPTQTTPLAYRPQTRPVTTPSSVSATVAAIVEHLKRGPAVCELVTRSDLRPLPKTVQQAVDVRVGRVRSEASVNLGGIAMRQISIEVECRQRVKTGEPMDAAIDSLLATVYTRLFDERWALSDMLTDEGVDYQYGLAEEGVCSATLLLQATRTTPNNSLVLSTW